MAPGGSVRVLLELNMLEDAPMSTRCAATGVLLVLLRYSQSDLLRRITVGNLVVRVDA